MTAATYSKAIYPGLYPAKFHDEIVNFEKEMGKKLGPTVRVLVYHEILQPEFHSLASDICGYHTSFVEDQLFRRFLPRGLAKGMRKLMDINNDTSRLSLTAVKEVFSEVSNRLEGGKKQYLFGHDSITAADLTFAALSYPLLRPVEMGAMLGGSKYPDTAWPQRLNDIRDELRATPAGQHVLKMYSLHRFGVGQAPKRKHDEATCESQVDWKESDSTHPDLWGCSCCCVCACCRNEPFKF